MFPNLKCTNKRNLKEHMNEGQSMVINCNHRKASQQPLPNEKHERSTLATNNEKQESRIFLECISPMVVGVTGRNSAC